MTRPVTTRPVTTGPVATRPPTALVTGGTGGIGAAVAAALAARGYRLLVTGRDPARGRTAERELLRAGAAAATFLATDHASIEATDRLVELVRRHVEGHVEGHAGGHAGALDVLVANAAAMPLTPTRTAEGLDVGVAVDVVGVVALVDGLLPLLAAAPHARVVLVTSDAATRFPVGIHEDPWHDGTGRARRGAPTRAYARAKRWKLDLAAGLAGELRAAGVVVHAASPGPAWTPMTRAMTRRALGVPLPLWWLIRAVQRAARPSRAARCVVHAVTDPRHGRVTGTLLRGRDGGRRRDRQVRLIPADPARAADALATARRLVLTTRWRPVQTADRAR